MQNNTITIEAVPYDRFQEYTDRSVYTAPDHSIGLNHLFSLSRVVPSSEGATARVRVKLVRDVIDPVTLAKGTIYTTIEVSQPTWAVPSDVSSESAKAAAFMLLPEYGQLLQKQSI